MLRNYSTAPGYLAAQGKASQRLGFAIAFALHAAVAAALLSYAPARSALMVFAPIMVSLIPPAPEAPTPKPRPRLMEPPPKLPILAAATQEPTPFVAPQPEPPKSAPPVEAPPPATIIPPRFDAVYLDNPAPSYPLVSRRLHEEGKVLLRVLVNPGGSADRVEIKSSSGSQRLDQAALDTVRRWRFVPAKQGAEPVAAWVVVPISFTLEG
jgi:periplasmic protein TonB